jgi:hypothetical protein
MDLTISSGSVSSNLSRNKKEKRKKRRPNNDQRFANYLVFGLQSTLCLGLFVICYAMVLIILWPLLKASTPKYLPDETPRDYIKHMHVPPVKTRWEKWPRVCGSDCNSFDKDVVSPMRSFWTRPLPNLNRDGSSTKNLWPKRRYNKKNSTRRTRKMPRLRKGTNEMDLSFLGCIGVERACCRDCCISLLDTKLVG